MTTRAPSPDRRAADPVEAPGASRAGRTVGEAAASIAGPPAPSGAGVYRRALEIAAGGREVESLQCGNGSAAVFAALYASHPYALSVPALAVPRIAINLTAARVRGGAEGDRSRSFDARRHSLFLTPAGVPVSWQKDSPSRHLGLYFAADLLEVSGPDAICLQNVSVPGIGPLADELVDELQNIGLLKAEAVDSLTRLLLVRLLRRAAGAPASAASALSPKALLHLREYIFEHLDGRILVADLARQVGLSPNHFAASFAERTGQSPHRFVRSLRLERAAELLGRSNLPLAQVAHDCGFASQQHLSNVFRKVLGTTPSRYRQGVRPTRSR